MHCCQVDGSEVRDKKTKMVCSVLICKIQTLGIMGCSERFVSKFSPETCTAV